MNCTLFSPAPKTNPRAFFVQSLKGAVAFTLTFLLFFCLNNGALIFLKETEPKEDEETYFKDWLILSCKLGNTRFTRQVHSPSPNALC